ncbi:hypothetical protein [Enterococcus sp. CSURQ0835]|uniref:hypothetical protein n=1 Tax=Enterococcus sp. CSURQ0835 TaxID=2681394 RepID=UPI00135BC499|nr:hypothetical protein [Enterococcus sp. CSURQ0835]
MKINYLALLSILFLDLILIGIVIAWISLVFALWCVTLTFLLAPLLLLIINVTNWQDFSALNLTISLLLSTVSYFWLLPRAQSFTRYTRDTLANVIEQQKNKIFPKSN